MSATERSTLLDREAELARFEVVVGDLLAGEGSAIVIAGPPGIGKTSLLEVLADEAASSTVSVLRARGSELERSFAFGALHQLLDPVLADSDGREALLSGAAALAEPVFSHHRSARGEPEDSYSVVHGLYWLVSNLARREPTLLVVDDAHWLDEPSRRFLAFLEQRLGGMALGLAVAQREDPAGGVALGRRGEVDLVQPAPLGPQAVERLVEQRVGSESAGLAEACERASGGNPFLLVELLGALERAAAADGEPSERDVANLAPDSVRSFALERVAAIEDGERFARALAVLGDGAGIDRVAELSELDVDRAGAVADELAKASILAGGRPLGFAHPIIRVAIHDGLPRGLRSALHRHAAAIATDRGDPGRAVATHLLETDPAGEESTVTCLVEVAAEAVARGAPDSAVALLRRAAEEPPRARYRSLVSFELGSQLAMLGDPEGIEHLRAALASAGDAERARIGLVLVDVLLHAGRMPEAVAELDAARAVVPAEEPELDAALVSRLFPLACSAASGRRLAGGRLAAATEEAERRPEATSGPVLAGLAFDAVVGASSDAGRALELAERALGHVEPSSDPVFVAGAINACFLADDFERAEARFETLIGISQSRGRARDFAMFSGLRAWSRWLEGRLAGAEADARAALELAGEGSWQMLTSLPASVIASIDLERGNPAGAEEVTAPLERFDRDADIGFTQLLHIAVARRFASTGDHEAALARLAPCRVFEREWVESAGIKLVNPWRAVAAPSLAAMGREAEARELAAEQLAAAETFGGARGIGSALRLGAAVGEPAEALGSLERAVGQLEEAGALLELAHAEVELGSGLRREGQRTRSRELLTSGMNRAHRIGATALAEEAREELVLAGARPRRLATSGPESLTASERRVARMAADGMMNREIAQSLFVTLRTVEGHLSNAFRKLEIGSREELARALRRPE